MHSQAVTLDGRPDERLEQLATGGRSAAGDIGRGLDIAAGLTGVPLPGDGSTAERWELLATLGAADLTVARIAEPHLDALAILAEAAVDGHPVDLGRIGAGTGDSWGVFAAEAPDARLDATEGENGWQLDGVKPWCSLAGVLSHALVTAHVDGDRRLFAVALRRPGVAPDSGSWHARGLTAVTSGPVRFTAVPATPVGPPSWYLTRDGFWHGGAGVAAVWWGGSIGIARALHARARRQRSAPLLAMHLGAVDTRLYGVATALASVALEIDAGRGAPLLADRVRAIAHDAAEDVITRVGHALGPAPLALDEEHARRVADLTLYLRQHHAERAQQQIGDRLAEEDGAPW